MTTCTLSQIYIYESRLSYKESSEDRRGLTYIAVGSLSVYGTV